MSKIIFSRETNNKGEWLTANDDGTLTHHVENSGWATLRNGAQPRDIPIKPRAAKKRWPAYAQAIDDALSGERSS